MFTNIYNTEIYDIYQIWYQSKTRVDMFEFPVQVHPEVESPERPKSAWRRAVVFFLGVKSVGEAGTRLEIRHEIFLRIFFLRNLVKIGWSTWGFQQFKIFRTRRSGNVYVWISLQYFESMAAEFVTASWNSWKISCLGFLARLCHGERFSQTRDLGISKE